VQQQQQRAKPLTARHLPQHQQQQQQAKPNWHSVLQQPPGDRHDVMVTQLQHWQAWQTMSNSSSMQCSYTTCLKQQRQ
jgi:hypothetical protein